jgi:quercetin dioxygenase-like cupin family protein
MSEVGPMAKPKVLIDNERTRVTEWRFAPGAATGWHRHAFDYLVAPLTDGRLKLVAAGGEVSYAELKVGQPYFRKAGVEHDVVNDNDHEFAFLEVEYR